MLRSNGWLLTTRRTRRQPSRWIGFHSLSAWRPPFAGLWRCEHDMVMMAVPMPRLGESVTEGAVERWLKAEGETVQLDEPLVEVVTDKVTAEIPSPFAGTLVQILV